MPSDGDAQKGEDGAVLQRPDGLIVVLLLSCLPIVISMLRFPPLAILLLRCPAVPAAGLLAVTGTGTWYRYMSLYCCRTSNTAMPPVVIPRYILFAVVPNTATS